MPHVSHLPRPLLTAAAVLLATGATLYSALWMYAVRHQLPPVEIGYEPAPGFIPHCQQIRSIYPDSPAQRAGLRPDDCILAVNDRSVAATDVLDQAWWNARPGDPVALTIERPGVPGTLILHAFFRARESKSQEGLARSSAMQVLGSYPAPFLLVGIAVLFLRREDKNAWLLALVFCAFIGAAPLPAVFYSLPSYLRPFMNAYRALFLGLIGAVFYIFFAVFPAASPLERRAPWLKWVALAWSASVILPGLHRGDMTPPAFLVNWIGPLAARGYVLLYVYGFISLGVVALIGNAFNTANPVVSRKSRLILWGTAVGVLPVVAERAAMDFAHFQPPFWFDTAVILNLAIFPLAFAYVVIKHRVMEFPLLLKRSARYLLVQRGFIVLLFVGAAVMIAVFTRAFSQLFSASANTAMILSAVFGVVLVWTSAPVIRRGTERIDRAFFRSAYDARRILEDLAGKARTVTDRGQLATLMELHIEAALHPKSLAFYLEDKDGRLVAESGSVGQGSETVRPARARPKFPIRFGARFFLQELDTIPADLALLSELAQRGKAWDVPPSVFEEMGETSALAPECLVPILGRNSRLIGLLILGPRRSEEPYSGEDKHLLESVAGQAGITLENISLAEQMAERIEAERRAAHEMEIARDVQAKLFPQKLPPLATLEYAGNFLQARVVGGDYYDFLDLAPGRVAIVLADIAGKGISGALLMANLQANLRSQFALALEDIARLLHSVNRLFCENTPAGRYATLFYAEYQDEGRRLRYANCGHNPPLLLRADGSLERLGATATVLGLFTDWECSVEETTLQPGDTLVLYTDGVTEAPNAVADEFGEERLAATIRAQARSGAAVLLSGITSAVQQFSTGVQADDLTLIVACGR